MRSSFSTTSFPRPAGLSLHLRRPNQRRQFHSQCFVSSEEQRFQGAFRTAEDARYFIVIHLLILVQQDGGPLLLGQGLHCAADLLGAVAPDEFHFNAGLPVSDFQRRLLALSIGRTIESGTIDGDFLLTITPVAQGV